MHVVGVPRAVNGSTVYLRDLARDGGPAAMGPMIPQAVPDPHLVLSPLYTFDESTYQ